MAVWQKKLANIFLRSTAAPEAQPKTEPVTPSSTYREILSLISPYFQSSEERNLARARLATIIGLSFVSSGTSLYFNSWFNNFVSTTQTMMKNPGPAERGKFNDMLLQFGLIAAAGVVMTRQSIRTQGALKADWNAWMLNNRISQMMDNNVHIRLTDQIDTKNPTAVMKSSIHKLTHGSVDLGVGALNAATHLPPFAYILYTMSGTGDISIMQQTVNVPGYLMWGGLAYATAGAIIAHRAGKPLVELHDTAQRKNANLDNEVARLQRDAKNIAIYKAEAKEQENFSNHVEASRQAEHAVINKNASLSVLRRVDTDIGFVLPYLGGVAAGSKNLPTLGDLMQIAHAFWEVQNSLRWYFNNRSEIAHFRTAAEAIINHDRGVTAAADADRRQYNPDSAELRLIKGSANSDIIFKNVTIMRPGTDEPLLENFSATIARGSRVVIMAPAGWGKTTLLNTMDGRGNGGTGEISLPQGPKTLMIPQERFIPPMNLTDILSYPASGKNTHDKKDMLEALTLMGLEKLIPDLEHDEEIGTHYRETLSGGEGQRLTFARILLLKPEILVMDEITSSLDADWERKAYKTLLEKLPHTTIISISHRREIVDFHDFKAVPIGLTLDIQPLNVDKHVRIADERNFNIV